MCVVLSAPSGAVLKVLRVLSALAGCSKGSKGFKRLTLKILLHSKLILTDEYLLESVQVVLLVED